ncbi:MAG: polysaccharide pyruvyl transferase family protein, partial [Planctomycetota bacterium]
MLVDTPVVIIGGFGLGNFGDDLLMLAAVNSVRDVYNAEDITVLIYRGGERYCHRLDPTSRYVARDAETIIRSQAAIYGGGTQFYDFGPTNLRRSRWESAWRFWEGIVSGRMSLANLWSPQEIHIDIEDATRQAAISIGLGPFQGPGSQQIAARKLAGCEFLSVRDDTSMEYCREWGLSHASLHADFGYASSLWGTDLPELRQPTAPHTVGIIVRDWYRTEMGYRHLPASVELANALARRGHQPKFFVFDRVGDTTSRRLVKRKAIASEVWNPNVSSIAAKHDSLAQIDILVTARAHGAIVGSVLGIPSVCTVIEPKLKIMSASLGEA